MSAVIMTGADDQAPQGMANMLWQRLLALPILLCACVAAIMFPVIPYLLLTGILGYAILLLWRRDAWLAGLPLLLPVVELAPWSGRLLFDGFDMFALTTLAACLWHNSYHIRNFRLFSPGLLPVLVLVIAAWGISFIHGAWPLPPLDGNALSGYYTHYNSLRIFKGFLWAMLLAPPLIRALRQDPERAQQLLCAGLAMALIAVGLVVLWERGVIGDLLQARDRYVILGDLLNFTTTYRVTGLFSEMHTGGAQIDGFLALVWPFALLPAFLSRQWFIRASGVLALGLGLYAMAVTFSRDVYAAFAVSSLALLLGLIIPHRRQLSPMKLLWLAPALGALAAVAVYDHQQGGTVALGSAMISFVLLGGLFAETIRIPVVIRLAIGATAGLITCFGVAYGMTTSKWAHNAATVAVIAAVVTAVLSGTAGAALGTSLRGLQRLNIWLLLILIGTVFAGGVSAINGYRMETRFATSSHDAQTRFDHWHDVLAAMSPTWTARAIGMGLGRFPYDYLIYKGDEDHIGTYGYHSDSQGHNFLRLGGGKDTEVGQRIPLEANTRYKVTARVRTHDTKAMLILSVCEKNILFQEQYQPNCMYPRLIPAGPPGQWQEVSAVFDTGKIGRRPWYSRWPTVLLIRNPRGGTVVDVDSIAMLDPHQHDILTNGDFNHGGDRWYSYNNYAHLQWHTKNLWLNVYFEQGLLGVLALLMWLIYALDRGIQRIRRGDSYALIATAGVCGFLTVGMFGSLFDAPRLTFLFILLLWSLTLDPHRFSSAARAARQHRAIHRTTHNAQNPSDATGDHGNGATDTTEGDSK